MKSILIFAYYSYKDPVFQSAVLPYFLDFPEKQKYKFVLLTFEQEKFEVSEQEKNEIQSFLKEHNIEWKSKKWHSGSFKLLKKAFDFIYSIFYSIYLIKKNNLKIIYSEGFPGAIITHFISKITRTKHIVHTFEPHADYMIESGVWQKNSWEARMIKKMELGIAKNAFAIFTATEGYIEKFKSNCPNTIFERVPSCVDLKLFQFSENHRAEKRKALQLTDNHNLLVYLGKFGGMYWDEEIFDLLEFFNQNGQVNYKLLIISKDDSSKYSHRLNGNIFWISAAREEVAHWLSAADLAICGIKNIPSRSYSSPIKNGEYWAMGLKVVVPVGISDDYLLAEKEQIGYVLKGNSTEDYQEILEKIESDSSAFVYSEKARFFAESDRSVQRFQLLYHTVFEKV